MKKGVALTFESVWAHEESHHSDYSVDVISNIYARSSFFSLLPGEKPPLDLAGTGLTIDFTITMYRPVILSQFRVSTAPFFR